MESAALKNWEIENAVKLVDPQRDALYAFDVEQSRATINEAPWRKDPHYFKNVRISAMALLKMVTHARSGGSIEVMGLMLGKVLGDTFIVADAFRLPVEGTETRVNASDQANEYIVQYLDRCRENGSHEYAVGWYHSHPGYGCWLSGIDVGTQAIQQQYQEPALAVVIDPDRTIAAGKVEIGAFRTYPEGYQPPEVRSSETSASVPQEKIEDFGVHAKRYYALEVSHYKSTLDTQLLELLWNKYWVSTLSQSALFTNRDYVTKQMLDLGQKMRIAERSTKSGSRSMGRGDRDRPLDKVIQASNKIEGEEHRGLLAEEIKATLFGSGMGPMRLANVET